MIKMPSSSIYRVQGALGGEVKTLEKDCFGSAGYNVKIRITLEYVGDGDVPDEGTIELT